MSIVTLTINPALDKSTSVDRIVPEKKLRCDFPRLDAGGGGINVSKGIAKLKGRSTAVFPIGGDNGKLLHRLVKESGVACKVVKIEGDTRENFSVLETGGNLQYRFNMPGTPLSADDARQCLEAVRALSPSLLVASGSLPPGLPDTWYKEVAAFAHDIGARFILDTSGKPLLHAAEEGVYLLKPNLGELSALSGVEKLEMNQVDDAAYELIRSGKVEVVVVSLGAAGAVLVSKDKLEHIPAPTVMSVSTVGAGDSMVAGMVWALGRNKSLTEVVQTGVACGSAATMNKGTQLFIPEDVEKLIRWIKTYGKKQRFTKF